MAASHCGTESALRESGDTFRAVVGSVRDVAAVVLEANGCIASWNSGAEQFNGYRDEEVIGENFSTLYSKEDIADVKHERHLAIAADLGRLEDEDWRVRKDGTRIMASVVITAIRDQTRQLQGFVKVTRDISERAFTNRAMHTLNQ